MNSRLARIFIVISTVLCGLMAGSDTDRYIVQVPAWRHLGAGAWADYSRYADLGNGLFLYPVLAIGSAVFLIAAAVSIKLDKKAKNKKRMPVYLALIFALTGLFFTVFAAPIMLSLPGTAGNPSSLGLAFEHFHFWGLLRAAVQFLAFGASVWAMAGVYPE
jgi:hypothetical protein